MSSSLNRRLNRLFLIGVELIDIKGMKNIYAKAPSEFWVALITAAVVVFWGVEQGILLVMVLSLLDHVRRGYKPKNAVVVPRLAHPAGKQSGPVRAGAAGLPLLAQYVLCKR